MNETAQFFVDLFITLHENSEGILVFECPVCEQTIRHNQPEESTRLLDQEIADFESYNILDECSSLCMCKRCCGVICVECALDTVISTFQNPNSDRSPKRALSLAPGQIGDAPISLNTRTVELELSRLPRRNSTVTGFIEELIGGEELRVTDSRTSEQHLCPLCYECVFSQYEAQSDNETIETGRSSTLSRESQDDPIVLLVEEAHQSHTLSMEQYLECVEPVVLPDMFQCPVCLEEELICDKLSCGHVFCRDCLKRSVDVKRQCPMCRSVICLSAAEM